MSSKQALLSEGQQISHYTIEGVLGSGGMGQVYRAKHKWIGKPVAIKVLHRQHAQQAEVLSRFFQEAKSVNDIHHENIVDVLDFGETPNGECYLVMELLEGQALSAVLRSKEPIPVKRLGHIGLQLCAALYAAHQKDIIHRDLKPDNIFLTTRAGQRDFVKLLDFGIAKVKDNAQHQTQTGMVLGTPAYMAPEQALGKPVTALSDLYSLGIILYQMATGQLPFYAETPYAFALKHVNEEIAPPHTKMPSLPHALSSLIMRCLQKSPKDRYSSMRELSLALGAACGLSASGYFGGERVSIEEAPPKKTEDSIEMDSTLSLSASSLPIVAKPKQRWWLYPLFAASLAAILLLWSLPRSKPTAPVIAPTIESTPTPTAPTSTIISLPQSTPSAVIKPPKGNVKGNKAETKSEVKTLPPAPKEIPKETKTESNPPQKEPTNDNKSKELGDGLMP